MIDFKRVAQSVLEFQNIQATQISVTVLNRADIKHQSAWVLLVFINKQKHPAMILKLSDDEIKATAIRQEYENLTFLKTHLKYELNRTIPDPFYLGESESFTILAETAFKGNPLKRHYLSNPFIKNRLESDLRQITAWLLQVHHTTAGNTTPALPSENHSDPDAAIETFCRFHRRSAKTDTLLSETAKHLQNTQIPMVLWHGDLCVENILTASTRPIFVIDWEYPLIKTWPLCDLLHMISSMGRFSFKKRKKTRVSDYKQIFFTSHQYAHLLKASVHRYLKNLGVDIDSALYLSAMAWVLYANRKQAEIHQLENRYDVRIDDATYSPLILLEDQHCLNLEILAQQRCDYFLI